VARPAAQPAGRSGARRHRAAASSSSSCSPAAPPVARPRAIGHPLVGDPVYGEARHRGLLGPLARRLAEFPRPALHAWRLAFAHPVSGRAMKFEAPLPPDLVALWRDVAGTELPLG
jgi:hypothetical protein